MFCDDGNITRKGRKETLLQKYDMREECLSYEHLEKCSNVKELEKILKVLRSGEEGHYPHLEKATEDKLQKLCPNNHLLRVETHVIRTSSLGPQERQLVTNDMQKWAEEMAAQENQSTSEEPMSTDEVPAVRSTSVCKAVTEKNKVNKSTSPKLKEKPLKKCVPSDYTFWDKFDADEEVLKMDLEEERQAEKKAVEQKQKEEIQRNKMKQNLEEEDSIRNRIKETAGCGDRLSQAEREFHSLQEKLKGNEYFQSQDMLKALERYTRSISFLPNVDALNNRAQTYLKLKNYPAALKDSETVLSMDPLNVKAYYRRGSALLELEKYHEALDDFDRALELNPNDKGIQEAIKKTRLKLGNPVSSKRVRVAIQTKSSSSSVVEEVNSSDSSDKYYPFFNTSPNEDIVLNAIGTAKIMCRCNGTPGFMKKVRSLEDIKDHGRLCLRRGSRPQKKDVGHAVLPEIPNLRSHQMTSDQNQESCSLNCKEDNVSKAMKMKEHNFKSNLQTAKRMPSSTLENNDALTTLEKNKTPYSFSVFWNSIKNVNDLPAVARALRVLSPEQMSSVIGNKLEEKMLNLFILALRTHFSLPDEWGVVQQYLHSFTKLPRFVVVNMMLDKGTKKELELLLNEAESLGLRVLDLLQLYGLTTCS